MKTPPLSLSTRLLCLRFMAFSQARELVREHLAEARACFKCAGLLAEAIGRSHLEIARAEARRARAAWEALCLA